MFYRIVEKLLDAVVMLFHVLVTIGLAIIPDRTFSEELSEKIEQHLPVPEVKDLVVSTCCDAPVELRKVGQELFGLCGKCGAYIGHLASRKLALLETNFESLLLGACRERQVKIRLSEPEVRTVYGFYISTLHKFAPQAVRNALRQFMPIEYVDKQD